MNSKEAQSMKPLISIDLIEPHLHGRGFISHNYMIGGKEFTTFSKPGGRPWVTRRGRLSYPFIQYGMFAISLDKVGSQDFTSQVGMTTPQTVILKDSLENAMKLLDDCKRVVVKPLDSYGSRGVTTNITTHEQLIAAYEIARKYSKGIIAQQHFYGQEYRFVVLDGKVASVLLRQKPQVTGDGIHTLQALIKTENDTRAALDHRFLQYPAIVSEMLYDASTITSQIIPRNQESITLGPATLLSKGASVYEVMPTVHASYIEKVQQLAEACNPEFIIIDLLIEDPSAAMAQDNYTFLEFNTSPSLKFHASVRTGEQYDMTAALASKIDDWCMNNRPTIR